VVAFSPKNREKTFGEPIVKPATLWPVFNFRKGGQTTDNYHLAKTFREIRKITMKRTAVILIWVAILLTAAPVSAQGKETVGERLSIFYSGVQTFPEGTPFYIAHGWILDPTQGPPGKYLFQLEVDGVYREVDYIDISVDRSTTPEFLSRRFVFNFPEGMSGTHIFTGHWLVPCGELSDSCANPVQLIESRTSTVTVKFEP
jgi:hypothetical protein